MGCISGKPAGERTLESVYKVDSTCLGQGQYAKVFLAEDRNTGKEVAIKKIDIAHSREENLETEISILQKFGNHRHIIELFVSSFVGIEVVN
jgi:serine/threonine protein kinase